MQKISVNKTGLYHFTHAEYHADPAPIPSLSRSSIKELIYRSPLHCWHNHPRLNPTYKSAENEKFDLGTAAHALLLEGAENIAIVDADDWRKKEAREQRDLSRKEGKTPLLKYQYDSARLMVHSAQTQIEACKELQVQDLYQDGNAELSLFWEAGETWCRCRPDWMSADKKIILDYKTTEMSVNPSDISRHILAMGLDIQAAFYSIGAKAVFGIEPKFIFVFQENREPFICSFISLPPDFLALGKSKVEYGMYLWEKCLRTNEWPGYPSRVCYPDLPAWALAAWDNRASGIGEGA